MKTVAKTTVKGNAGELIGISAGNQNLLAELAAITGPGFVNEWLSEIIPGILFRDLPSHLDGHLARTPAQARQIAARANAFLKEMQYKGPSVKAVGRRLAEVKAKEYGPTVAALAALMKRDGITVEQVRKYSDRAGHFEAAKHLPVDYSQALVRNWPKVAKAIRKAA